MENLDTINFKIDSPIDKKNFIISDNIKVVNESCLTFNLCIIYYNCNQT